MKKQKFIPLVLFLLAFFCAGTVHLVNHNKLSRFAPNVLRNQVTVSTADDASYLAPAENFIARGEWKSNAAGNASVTTRTPGYSLIYVVFRIILPVQHALIALVVFQLLLFALAVALIPHIATFLNLNFVSGIAIAVSVAMFPTFSGFLSYTLSEAVTPSLVLIFLFGLFQFYRQPKNSPIPVALLLGFLILVRPPMLIWVFAPAILAVYHFREMRFKQLITLVVISIIPIMVWQVFISVKTGEIQSLHPIYHNDSNDLYRPLHGDIWNFHKSWGQTGFAFNNTVNQLWADAIHGADPRETISEILKNTDRTVINLIGENDLRYAYLRYFEILGFQVPYAKKNLPLKGVTDGEKELSATFKQFRTTYIQANWFYSKIVVPAKVYMRLGSHSNLSLFVFQKSWRGNVFMEALRYFSFFIHFGVFLCFPVASVITRKSVPWLSISIPVLIYLGYICIVQRGVEERYTLPVLIPMLLVVVGAGHQMFVKWRFNFLNRG